MKASADSKKSRRPSAGEFVEHEQHAMAAVLGVQLLGQAAANLVQHQPDQRFGAADIGGWYDQIEGGGPARRKPDPRSPVAPARDLRHDGIAVRGRRRKDMAVESTPERSLSDLLSSSRAAEATTGCGPFGPRWQVVIMARSVASMGRFGSERKPATPARVLSVLGIEDVQDRAHKQRVAGLLPMVPAFERALGIDQHVGDVLHVAGPPIPPFRTSSSGVVGG